MHRRGRGRTLRAAMRLELQGDPLHTRSLSVTLLEGEPDRVVARASLLDLRKRGFVPVGGDLQPAGIVHDMRLEAEVARSTERVLRLEAAQPVVAFEPSALTRGESCRDIAGGMTALAGACLDTSWSRRVSEASGGPRGCSHLVTLAQLLGPTIHWALGRERDLVDTPAQRRRGEWLFRRAIVVDGALGARGESVGLAVQLTDLHSRPAAPGAPSMERFAEALEVRALAEIALGSQRLLELRIAERRRTRTRLDTAWSPREALGADLRGLSFGRGVSAVLVERLGEHPGDRPLLDALLALAPTLIQVYAALSERWPEMAAQDGWVVGLGSRPDACWMWRGGGALDRARAPGDPRLFS